MSRIGRPFCGSVGFLKVSTPHEAPPFQGLLLSSIFYFCRSLGHPLPPVPPVLLSPTLPCPTLPYHTLSYPALPCPTLPYPVLSHLPLAYGILPYLILLYIILPDPTRPYPTLACVLKFPLNLNFFFIVFIFRAVFCVSQLMGLKADLANIKTEHDEEKQAIQEAAEEERLVE